MDIHHHCFSAWRMVVYSVNFIDKTDHCFISGLEPPFTLLEVTIKSDALLFNHSFLKQPIKLLDCTDMFLHALICRLIHCFCLNFEIVTASYPPYAAVSITSMCWVSGTLRATTSVAHTNITVPS